MSYHLRTHLLATYCPGIQYVRQTLTGVLSRFNTNDAVFTIDDGGVPVQAKPAMVSEGLIWAILNVDGVVTLQVESEETNLTEVYALLYDGPYTEESASEIVVDYSSSVELPLELRDRVEVESSNLSFVEYDKARNQVLIEFRNGAQYLYPNTPLHDFLSLSLANSPGGEFHRMGFPSREAIKVA